MSCDNYNDFNPYIIASSMLKLQDCPIPGTIYDKRVVRWYELELMNDADGGYIITDGKKLFAQKGEIFLRKPGMVVQGVSSYACDIIIFDVTYDKSLITEYNEHNYKNASQYLLSHFNNRNLSFDILNNLPPKIMITDYNYYKSYFDECFEHYIKQEDDFQFHGKRILLNLLFAINKEFEKQTTFSNTNSLIENHRDVIQKTKQYINDNFNDNITLKSISHVAGYNPDFFCRLFKKATGQSPINYLLNVRYVHAKRLLIATNYSIKKISLLCGFQNETYFYTFFKKKESISPMKFRMMNRYLSG